MRLPAFFRSMEDGLEGIRHLLDMSNAPETHPWYSKERHLVPGFLKEECGWNRQIKRAVFLRAKQYALELAHRETGEQSLTKKSKGVTRTAVEKIRFDTYLRAITAFKAEKVIDRRIQGIGFQMYTLQQQRVLMTGFDDKWQVFCRDCKVKRVKNFNCPH